jgi:hypothetical protein
VEGGDRGARDPLNTISEEGAKSETSQGG